MGSVYELHLAIHPSITDDERAKAIVDKLSEQRRVEDLGGSWWRTSTSTMRTARPPGMLSTLTSPRLTSIGARSSTPAT